MTLKKAAKVGMTGVLAALTVTTPLPVCLIPAAGLIAFVRMSKEPKVKPEEEPSEEKTDDPSD